MTQAIPVTAVEPSRYPTARETVETALGTAIEPPRYAYPCQDLDGNSHTLFVVPLGHRIALALPKGATAVLGEQAVIDLGGQLDDAFMTDVPGGNMSMGSVEVNATSNLCALEGTSLEIEVHAYAKEALLHLFSKDGHITIPLGLDVVQKLRQMLSDAERVMLGVVLPNRPDHDTETAAQIGKGF